MLRETGPYNPYQQYRQNQVATASPQQLLLMLFDGALRFLCRADEALKKQDFNAANNNLLRTQQIVAELISSLDFNCGELPENLFKIYDYIHRRLIEANVQKSREPLPEVERMLRELRDSWAQVGRATGESSQKKILSAGGL